MSEVLLHVSSREKLGRSEARRLRREGMTPGIYYINGKDATHIAVDAKTLRGVIAGESSVIDLDFGNGKPLPSIVKELQVDPVSSEFLHIDFLGVKLDEKIVVEVPIHIVGTAAGAKAGGIMQVLQRHIEVECLPLDIPDSIEVDVSELEINDSITLGAIEQEKFSFITEPETMLVTVLPPRLETEETEEETEEEEQAEPEVVGKGKKEDEESGEE